VNIVHLLVLIIKDVVDETGCFKIIQRVGWQRSGFLLLIED